jgi:hypothetical protein
MYPRVSVAVAVYRLTTMSPSAIMASTVIVKSDSIDRSIVTIRLTSSGPLAGNGSPGS